MFVYKDEQVDTQKSVSRYQIRHTTVSRDKIQDTRYNNCIEDTPNNLARALFSLVNIKLKINK